MQEGLYPSFPSSLLPFLRPSLPPSSPLSPPRNGGNPRPKTAPMSPSTGLLRMLSWRHHMASLTKRETRRSCTSSLSWLRGGEGRRRRRRIEEEEKKEEECWYDVYIYMYMYMYMYIDDLHVHVGTKGRITCKMVLLYTHTHTHIHTHTLKELCKGGAGQMWLRWPHGWHSFPGVHTSWASPALPPCETHTHTSCRLGGTHTPCRLGGTALEDCSGGSGCELFQFHPTPGTNLQEHKMHVCHVVLTWQQVHWYCLLPLERLCACLSPCPSGCQLVCLKKAVQPKYLYSCHKMFSAVQPIRFKHLAFHHN